MAKKKKEWSIEELLKSVKILPDPGMSWGSETTRKKKKR